METVTVRRSRLRVHSGEPSAELGYIHVGEPYDVRVIAPSAHLGDGRLDFLVVIVFDPRDIDPANSTFVGQLAGTGAAPATCPSGQSVTMAADLIGLQMSFPLAPDASLDALVLRIGGPVLGAESIEFELVFDRE